VSVKSQAAVTVEFTTANPTTGAAQNGDALPTGILYVDGVANAAAVTVTNITTGVYRAAVTLPALTAGQMVGIRISCAVATVTGTAVVWQDAADTSLPSDNATAIAAIPTTPLLAANYTAPANADITTIKNAVGTPVNTGGTATLAAILGDPANSSLVARMSAVPAAVWAIATSTLTATGTVGKRLIDFVTTLVYAAPPGAAPSASDNASAVWSAATRTLSAFGFTVNTNDAAVPSAADNASAVWGATTRSLTDKTGFSGTATNMRGTDDAMLAASYVAPDNADIGTILTNLNDLVGDIGEPVGADLSADIAAVKGAIPAAAPAASDIADAVWDEAVSGHTGTGKTGKALVDAAAVNDISGLATTVQETANTKAITDAIAAAKPTIDLSSVTDAIAALPDDTDVAAVEALLAAIKAVTDSIESSPINVTFTTPVTQTGTINLNAGDSYPVKHGRIGITVDIDDATHAMDLDAQTTTVRLKAAQVTWVASSVTSTTAGWRVRWTPTVAETKTLTVSRQSYEVEAEYAETPAPDNVSTIFAGTIVTTHDIPAVS